MSTRCQGEPGCPNEGLFELTVVGNVDNNPQEETIRALLCAECARKAISIVAAKIVEIET